MSCVNTQKLNESFKQLFHGSKFLQTLIYNLICATSSAVTQNVTGRTFFAVIIIKLARNKASEVTVIDSTYPYR